MSVCLDSYNGVQYWNLVHVHTYGGRFQVSLSYGSVDDCVHTWWDIPENTLRPQLVGKFETHWI